MNDESFLRHYKEIDALDAPTRAVVRYLVAEQMKKGTSPYELQVTLRNELGIGREAAETIARTELATANQILSLESMRQAEALEIHVLKGWTTAHDDNVCEACKRNESAGLIPLDEPFPSGQLHPPAHPNCRCALVPHRVVE